MALLHLLARLSRLRQLELQVLHFNHGLRPESQDEVRLVEQQCSELQIPFQSIHSTDLAELDSGLPAQAREWRRAESQRVAKESGCDWIVTAHHADDQAETLLLKLLRGAHLSHFQGMRWTDPPFLRPLLSCSKQELREFLQRHNLPWREDASNTSPDYLRNRVRQELIPLLQELTRHGLPQRLHAMEEQSTLLEEWLSQALRGWEKHLENPETLVVPESWKHLPEMVQEGILMEFLRKGLPRLPGYPQIQEVRKAVQTDIPQRWSFSGGITVVWDGTRVRVQR